MDNPEISVVPVPETEIKKITLKNDYLEVVLLNYGARLHQIFAPDKEGKSENILLSYDRFEDVLTDKSFFGATVGPVAGRIRDASWGEHRLEKKLRTTPYPRWHERLVFPVLGSRSFQNSFINRRGLLLKR